MFLHQYSLWFPQFLSSMYKLLHYLTENFIYSLKS